MKQKCLWLSYVFSEAKGKAEVIFSFESIVVSLQRDWGTLVVGSGLEEESIIVTTKLTEMMDH